jgi:hypothetical protein
MQNQSDLLYTTSFTKFVHVYYKDPLIQRDLFFMKPKEVSTAYPEEHKLHFWIWLANKEVLLSTESAFCL